MVQQWEESGSDNQLLDHPTLMKHIDTIVENFLKIAPGTIVATARQWEQAGKYEIALKFALGNYYLSVSTTIKYR